MSMDAVAARAKVSKATIYRRWTGKQELVLDAVRARGPGLVVTEDTGSLRGDLVATYSAARHGSAMFTIDASRTIISWAAASTARASQRLGSGSTAEAPCASPRASPEGRFGSVTVSPTDGWTDCFGPAWAG